MGVASTGVGLGSAFFGKLVARDTATWFAGLLAGITTALGDTVTAVTEGAASFVAREEEEEGVTETAGLVTLAADSN